MNTNERMSGNKFNSEAENEINKTGLEETLKLLFHTVL